MIKNFCQKHLATSIRLYRNDYSTQRPSTWTPRKRNRVHQKLVHCSHEGDVNGRSVRVSQEADNRVVHQMIPVDSLKGKESIPIVVRAQIGYPGFIGWFWSMLLVFMVAVSTTSAALAAFLLYIRPVLKTFEETCKATEKTSKQLETTAIELEEAAIMFDEQLPPALKSVEAAGKEFEELGHSLNSLSGGLISRRPSRHRRRGKESDLQQKGSEDISSSKTGSSTETALVPKEKPKPISKNITKRTMDSIQKVTSDLNTLTQSFGPAMDMWRRRLASIVTTVEAEQKANGENNDFYKVPSAVESAEGSSDNEGRSEDGKADDQELGGVSSPSVMEGVSIGLEGISSVSSTGDEDDYGTYIELGDLFKNKDSLVAKLANESTEDAATVIMDALYKAEEAAEEAARASGALQEAVERAKNSGAWDNDTDLEWDVEKEEKFKENNKDVKLL